MNENQLSIMMKEMGYDKITQIQTLKKEEHKIEHKHIYFDNKRIPYRSTITLKELKKLVNKLNGGKQNG